MINATSYVVVTPVRNEEKHIAHTIRSMLAQTVRAAQWVIVNDGSSDQTGRIAEETARANRWIKVIHRSDRGFRKSGGGVVEAFYEGYRLIENESWDFVVKLDGDLSFDEDYFERCFRHFADNPRLGIAGGTICNQVDGVTEVESKVDPRFHVRGATKIYRRECWRALGGLIQESGWDTVDEIKANMLGWQTYTLPELKVIHHRLAGAAYGAWHDRVVGGLSQYVVGYHPVFMFLKCLRRMAEKPYILGGCALLFGFLKGYVKKVPRVQDEPVIRYLRGQQINRLLLRKSLWG